MRNDSLFCLVSNHKVLGDVHHQFFMAFVECKGMFPYLSYLSRMDTMSSRAAVKRILIMATVDVACSSICPTLSTWKSDPLSLLARSLIMFRSDCFIMAWNNRVCLLPFSLKSKTRMFLQDYNFWITSRDLQVDDGLMEKIICVHGK